MPYTPVAYAYTPVKYVSESGSIPALLLYEGDGLSYLRFQTKSWPHYDGWGLWSTVGIWSEHVVRADPREPAVAELLRKLDRDATAAAAAAAARQRNGAGKSTGGNGQAALAPKTCAKKSEIRAAPSYRTDPCSAQNKHPYTTTVTQSNGVKPPPKPAKPPATQRKARPSGGDAYPLKPVRSIAGLTLADFVHNR